MLTMPKKVIFLVIFNVVLLAKTEEIKSQGRDFHGYFPPEDEKKLDYPILQYPPNYYPPIKDDVSECAKNPMLPLLGKGLNLLLLKLGVFGIIKAVMALIFLAFLVKLPLLLLKVAFFKSFFIPFLIAPLFLHMFTHPMNQSSEGGTEDKPSETPAGMEGIMGMNEMNMNMGRQLTENLTSVAWDSLRMFVESDQCVERISCMIGASNTDSSMGKVFSRMLKYLHYSSPPAIQQRMSLIREAYNKGSRTSKCLTEDYKCQSPELLIQQGLSKVKIL